MPIAKLLLSAGAMKAGTSYLYKLLERHPGIEATPVKEVHYFAHLHTPLSLLDDNARMHAFKTYVAYLNAGGSVADARRGLSFFSRYLRSPIDDAWYEGLFETGEATWKADFSNMASVLPDDGLRHVRRMADDVRVIYLLRDPLERLWSHVKFHAAVNGELGALAAFDELAFADYLAASGALAQGRYAENISRMRRHLSGGQLRVMYFEDMIASPQHELDAVCDFLGVEPVRFDGAELCEIHNPGPAMEMPAAFAAAARLGVEAEMERLGPAGIAVHPRWQV